MLKTAEELAGVYNMFLWDPEEFDSDKAQKIFVEKIVPNMLNNPHEWITMLLAFRDSCKESANSKAFMEIILFVILKYIEERDLQLTPKSDEVILTELKYRK